MSQSRLTASFRICATCVFWGGARTTDALRSYAVFDSNQQGKCLGGGFNHAMMNPRASCNQWNKWSVLK